MSAKKSLPIRMGDVTKDNFNQVASAHRNAQAELSRRCDACRVRAGQEQTEEERLRDG